MNYYILLYPTRNLTHQNMVFMDRYSFLLPITYPHGLDIGAIGLNGSCGTEFLGGCWRGWVVTIAAVRVFCVPLGDLDSQLAVNVDLNLFVVWIVYVDCLGLGSTRSGRCWNWLCLNVVLVFGRCLWRVVYWSWLQWLFPKYGIKIIYYGMPCMYNTFLKYVWIRGKVL